MERRTDLLVKLRDMTADDLPQAHALSRKLQWPHRIEDWDFMLRAGTGIVVEENGAIVGTIMGWPYGPEVATLGMVIVAGEKQGAGIGRQLMDAMMARLGDRTIVLNATTEGLPLYTRLGFTAFGEIRQHQGAAFSVPIPSLRPNERVRPLSSSDHDAIVTLDRRACGMDRASLFAELRKAAHGVVLDRDSRAIGFALFRRFGRGYVIGPVVAPDAEGAKTLISHWLGSNAGMFSRVDIPGDDDLATWLDDLGLPCVGRVTRMARGPLAPPDVDVHTFALASQALG
ncbi:GNAT family N-acetyltransferase [Nitrospirillum amazonense]|uniref:GNAT family N-acetyltransferase n=1 Tax=Nitrospirillum amazonense TaxID=28077 RepID=UPI002412E3B8|nr:GNAT family N-acetyltransferase [Nitrospirillum amazonense]MDG3439166.1 GNAT family N-acetyltransferase [Nitrospirillum amazonense]